MVKLAQLSQSVNKSVEEGEPEEDFQLAVKTNYGGIPSYLQLLYFLILTVSVWLKRASGYLAVA